MPTGARNIEIRGRTLLFTGYIDARAVGHGAATRQCGNETRAAQLTRRGQAKGKLNLNPEHALCDCGLMRWFPSLFFLDPAILIDTLGLLGWQGINLLLDSIACKLVDVQLHKGFLVQFSVEVRELGVQCVSASLPPVCV